MEKTLTVLVTGANRGIGLGLCKYYLNHGATVVAACRDPQALSELAATHEQLYPKVLDISQTESIEAFAEQIKKESLTFDIVINNAGITKEESFGNWSREAFLNSFVVNAMGPGLFIQGIQKSINDKAKIIQLSSGLASINNAGSTIDPYCSYAMSKAALNMLTVKLAAIFRHRGVIVSALNPGWVQTDMGGADAPDTVEQAARKLCATIASLDNVDSGCFISAKRELIPW